MQRKPSQVFYYRYAFDKYGAAPSERHLGAIEKLQNNQRHSVNREKLHSAASFDISSIRYSKRGRLKLTYKETKAMRYTIIIEDADQHQYEDKVADKSQRLADCIDNFEASLAAGEFLPLPKQIDSDIEEEKEEQDFYYHDGEFIETTTEQGEIRVIELPQYVTGAAGGGKTLLDAAVLDDAYDQGHNVLYVTQQPELADKVRDMHDKKYVKQDDDEANDYAVLDYVSLIRLVDPTLEKKTIVGESEFNGWLNDYLKARKNQGIPDGILKRKDDVYKELKNLSGYDEADYLSLGQDECLFNDLNEKKYLLQLYKKYQQHLKESPTFDPSFYEIKDFSLFEDYVVAIDEVDNFSTLQIKQLMRFAKFKDLIITGDNHQLMDDVTPKHPLIKKALGDRYKHTELTASKRCGKTIIRFSNQLITAKYRAVRGQLAKGEYSQIKIPADQHEGSLDWIGTADAKIKLLLEKHGKDKLVVITHPEFVAEAKTKFPGVTVITFNDCKGQGYNHVAVYRPFDTKIFAEADKEYASAEAKEKYNMPKQHERRNAKFASEFNKVFVGCTRAIESLTICQADNHAVRHIINDLRPVKVSTNAQVDVKQTEVKDDGSTIKNDLSPNVSVDVQSDVRQKEVSEEQEETKESSYSARLERAYEALNSRNFKAAESEREHLSDSDKEKFDEHKRKIEERRDEQKARESAKHQARREKKYKNKGKLAETEAPEAKAPEAKVPEIRSAKTTVTNTKPFREAQAKITTSSTSNQDNLKTRLNSMDPEALWKKILNNRVSLDKAFARRKDGSCDFWDYMNNVTISNSLKLLSITKREMVRKIPIEYMFKTYGEGDQNRPLVAYMPPYDGQYSNFIDAIFGQLTNAELIKIVKLFSNEIEMRADGSTIVTSTFRSIFEFSKRSKNVIHYLLEKYGESFAQLITGDLFNKKFARGAAVDGELLTETDLSYITRQRHGCEFFEELTSKNQKLVTEIEMKNIFGLLNPGQSDIRSVLVGMIEFEKNQGFLSKWFASMPWVDYILNLYDSAPVELLADFTQHILKHLLIDSDFAYNSILELFQRSPRFLEKLIPHGFFAGRLYPGPVFSIMSVLPKYHPYLKNLFDTQVNLYSQIDVAQFLTSYGFHVEAASPMLMLTQSDEGMLLLCNIIRARNDVRESLAKLSELFAIYRLYQHDRKTCLYAELKNSIMGQGIIKYLQQANPSLTDDELKAVEFRRGLVLIDVEQSAVIAATKANNTFDSFYSLLQRSDAFELLYGVLPSTTINSPFILDILKKASQYIDFLLQAINKDPSLIERIFPDEFFNMYSLYDLGHVFFINLLTTESGIKIIRLLSGCSRLMKHLRLDTLITYQWPGKDDAKFIFEHLLFNREHHVLLDALLKHDEFVAELNSQLHSCKLSGVALFTAICRYYPNMAVNLVQRVQMLPGEKRSVSQIIFGDSPAFNFYWLSLYPYAHEQLLLALGPEKSEPAPLDRISANVFGMTHAPRAGDEQLCSMLSLLKTVAGKKIIDMYLEKSCRASKLLSPELLCKENNNIMVEIERHHPEIARKFFNLNPKLKSSSHEIDNKSKFNEVLDKAGSMSELLRLNNNGSCTFIDLLDKSDFRWAIIERMRANPSYFLGVSILMFFNIYQNSILDKKQTLGSAIGYYAELHPLLVMILNHLGGLNDDAWIDHVVGLYHTSSPLELKILTRQIVVLLRPMQGASSNALLLLRVFKKYPDFVTQLVSNGIHHGVNSHDSVFGFLCKNSDFHVYLARCANWQKFESLSSEEFFAGEQNIPFNLSKTKEGIQVLNTLLMLRPDLRRQLAVTAELCKPIGISSALDKSHVTCLYNRLVKFSEGKDVLDALKSENKMLAAAIPQVLSENFLTDEECKVLNLLSQDCNVESLSEVMRRPDARRLLFYTSGENDKINLFSDLIINKIDILFDACEQHPDVIRAIPPDFLLSPLTLGGVRGRYLDLFFAYPWATKLINVLSNKSEFFASLNFDVLFKSENHLKQINYFEAALSNQAMHPLLLKMLDSKSNALVFAEKYAGVKLSEMNALSQACKYCPEFVLKLADQVSPKIKPWKLLFKEAESARYNFHWLALLSAHNKLFYMIKEDPFMLSYVTERCLCAANEVPFPSMVAISPLESLVQTSEGRWILRTYLNSPPYINRMNVAEPKYLCKAIRSHHSQYNGKSVLDILVSAMDVEGYDCTGLAVDLINVNPKLIEGVSLLSLALLQDALGLHRAIVDRINERLRQGDVHYLISNELSEPVPTLMTSISAPTRKMDW